MKQAIFFIFCILIWKNSNSQSHIAGILPLKEGKVSYEGVIPLDSVSKNELYVRAQRWFIHTYSSANDVIQYEDKEGGQLIGKGVFTVYWKINRSSGRTLPVYHTIDIRIKEGRYKLIISDFRVKYFNPEETSSFIPKDVDSTLEVWLANWNSEVNEQLCPQIDKEVRNLISSLKTSMSKDSKEGV